jgi:hypothetical protein
VGLWDGVEARLLNQGGKKNVTPNTSRFVYLCPEHFQLAIGNLVQQITPRESKKTEE